MIATLHLVCFRAIFVMRGKFPGRSILDWIYRISCYRVRVNVYHMCRR